MNPEKRKREFKGSIETVVPYEDSVFKLGGWGNTAKRRRLSSLIKS
ncbi:hypothetical protein A2U01_0082383, partial [Trifolium medium]|nr:hypothetical protein [Trifolium medium]